VSINILKEYLSERNAERCIEMLKQQKEKVDIEIQKLDRIRKKIDGRAKLLEKVIGVQDFEEVKFSSEEKECYMMERCKEIDEKEYMRSFITLCKHSKELQIDFENPVCNIIKKEDLLQGNHGNTSFFAIKIPENFQAQNIERFEKPYGMYASTYHQGSYDTMYLAYQRLLDNIKKEGYEVCGNAYETDLLSTLTSSDKDEYMKLISIQVKMVPGS
jgi:effector-binding domain-containing protein